MCAGGLCVCFSDQLPPCEAGSTGWNGQPSRVWLVRRCGIESAYNGLGAVGSRNLFWQAAAHGAVRKVHCGQSVGRERPLVQHGLGRVVHPRDETAHSRRAEMGVAAQQAPHRERFDHGKRLNIWCSCAVSCSSRIRSPPRKRMLVGARQGVAYQFLLWLLCGCATLRLTRSPWSIQHCFDGHTRAG